MNIIILFCVSLFLLGIKTQEDYDFRHFDDDPVLDEMDVEEQGCPKIDLVKNVNLKAILGQWHLPYMSKHYIHSMAKYMYGKYMKKSSLGRTCIKVNVKELAPGGTPNNTDATIWIQYKCLKTGTELNLACAQRGSNNSKWYCNDLKGRSLDDDSFIYIVDTDNRTWALVVRCFPKNGMNWAIFSKVKELSHNLTKSLLHKVELLGFKLNNVVEVPYSKCMTNPK